MKRFLMIILTLLFALGSFACTKSPTGDPSGERIITDSAGRQVTIPEAVESIVCVGVGALRYTCYMQGQVYRCGGKEILDRQALQEVYRVNAQIMEVNRQSMVVVD